MDSRLRQLQQQAEHGDLQATAQYWAALLRSGLIPEEYILGLSRIENPSALLVFPSPKNKGVKKYISWLLSKSHLPPRDLYDFSLACIRFLADEWMSVPNDQLAMENHYLTHKEWENALHYLSTLGPDKAPDVAILQRLLVQLGTQLTVSADNLTQFLTCDSSVELPLMLICVKMLYELKIDPLPDLEAGGATIDNFDDELESESVANNFVNFRLGGLDGGCSFYTNDLFHPWTKFLNLHVTLPMSFRDVWLHLWVDEVAPDHQVYRMPLRRGRKQLIQATKQQTARFNQMVESFLIDRITRATN